MPCYISLFKKFEEGRRSKVLLIQFKIVFILFRKFFITMKPNKAHYIKESRVRWAKINKIHQFTRNKNLRLI